MGNGTFELRYGTAESRYSQRDISQTLQVGLATVNRDISYLNAFGLDYNNILFLLPQINTMGDALWWTIQTMSTATYGPNPATHAGRIIGSITMIIGVGLAGVFISTLAAGLTKLRTTQKRSNHQLAYETKQTIKSEIDGLEELSEADIHVLLSMIKSLHNSLQK